jgi:hypothetical protein
MATVTREKAVRPLTFARARDALIVRKAPGAPLSVVLTNLTADDPAARPATRNEGIEASTGEALPANTSKVKLIVPLACSKWHEQKFLSGRATLRSSMIIRRGDRWFLQSQFEMADVPAVEPEGVLGLDRGLANTLVGAVVDLHGGVRALPVVSGAAIGDEINDVPMIRNAGLGIAMGNAIPAVKDIAARTTLRNDEDGVAHAVDKILEGEW